MTFGLQLLVETFQNLNKKGTHVLGSIFAYLEYLPIVSTSATKHMDRLHLLFSRMENYGLVINPKKYVLGVNSIDFFGPQVRVDEIVPLEAKVEAVVNFR